VFAFAAIFWVVPLPLQLLSRTFGIVAPINLRLMAALGIPPGDVMIALAFTGAAAAGMAAMGILPGDLMMGLAFRATAGSALALTFGRGGIGVCYIVVLLGESWVWCNCVNM
jgi:hypothetical protein